MVVLFSFGGSSKEICAVVDYRSNGILLFCLFKIRLNLE
jgi:hypothetical protein